MNDYSDFSDDECSRNSDGSSSWVPTPSPKGRSAKKSRKGTPKKKPIINKAMAGLSLERDTEVPINGNSKPIALLKTGDTKLSDVEKKDTIDDDGDEGNLKPAAVVANPDGAGNQPNVAPENYAWVCDICEKAKFRTREEAEVHEGTCSDFQFFGKEYVKHEDINSDYRKEMTDLIYGYVFSGPILSGSLSREDLLDIKAVFDKYNLKGSHVGKFLDQCVRKRRDLEKLYLKSDNPDDFNKSSFGRCGRWGGVQLYSKKYPTAFSEGLRRWDAGGRKTHLSILENLYKEALALIKANKDGTEPNVRNVELGHTQVIVNKATHDTQQAKYDDGKMLNAKAFKNQMHEDMKDVFDGTIPVRLFKAINDDKGFDGAQLSFNLQITDPSNFHGFTIHSGAGNLVDKLMEKYTLCGRNTNWSIFLTTLRFYGVKEDICNTGRSNAVGLGDLNERKFIFYHEHFHKDGLNELEKVVQLRKKVYRD